MNSLSAKIEKLISSLHFPLGHILIEYHNGDDAHEYFVSESELRRISKNKKVKEINVLKEEIE